MEADFVKWLLTALVRVLVKLVNWGQGHNDVISIFSSQFNKLTTFVLSSLTSDQIEIQFVALDMRYALGRFVFEFH